MQLKKQLSVLISSSRGNKNHSNLFTVLFVESNSPTVPFSNIFYLRIHDNVKWASLLPKESSEYGSLFLCLSIYRWMLSACGRRDIDIEDFSATLFQHQWSRYSVVLLCLLHFSELWRNQFLHMFSTHL